METLPIRRWQHLPFTDNYTALLFFFLSITIFSSLDRYLCLSIWRIHASLTTLALFLLLLLLLLSLSVPANVNHKERWVGQTRTCNDSCEPHWAGLRGELRAHVARVKKKKKTFQPLSGANDVGHFVLILCHLHQKSQARSRVGFKLCADNQKTCETNSYKRDWSAVHRNNALGNKSKKQYKQMHTNQQRRILKLCRNILGFCSLKCIFYQIQLWFS